MKKYYIEFKTWREGIVEMPGNYKILGELNEYRSRVNLNKIISTYEVQNTFLSLNEKKVDVFLKENVAACIIGILMDAVDEDSAFSLLNDCLGPIIIDGIVEVNDSNIDSIKKIMGESFPAIPPLTC
jgi:hypothetical protein